MIFSALTQDASWQRRRRTPDMPQTVKIYRAISDEEVRPILKEAVEAAGLRGKKRIFLKPNLSHFEYISGVVTSPQLTADLIGLLRDFAEEVIVGESEGYNYSCQAAFQQTGMQTAVKKAGGTILNLSEDKVIEVKFSDTQGGLRRLFLPKTALEADALINLPLMKTHEFMAYSGAIKNLFGCVPSNRRIFLHPYLPEVMYRLYTIFKPSLTIMDARVGIEGNGPTKGIPVPMGLVLTSNDSLATDIIASQVMQLDWRSIYLNYIARRAGLKPEMVTIEGLPISEVAHRFAPPRIDLPVKAQMIIYKHEYLTKFFFCSLPLVRLFQKLTVAYRGAPIEPA
jgi:uncharacterized protein (DUF362 family)